MIQGSNMTSSHKGMRKGISLIEMLMAIVLLGVLSTVGFKYYKIYYDTTFATKQAKVYILMDQAQQLSGAHDLYETKNAVVPATIAVMVTDKQLIVKPSVMPEISASGWDLYSYATGASATINLSGTTADNDIAFIIDVDSTTASLQDKLDYCNIVSNTGLNTWSLSSDDAAVLAIGTTAAEGYADAKWDTSMYCYASATTVYHMIFVKLVDPA